MSESTTASTNKRSSEGEAEARNDWREVLASCRAGQSGLTQSNLLVFGDRGSGKSHLLSRLRGVDLLDEADATVALGYTFLDIVDEETSDVLLRTNVWTLEGETVHKSLLNTVAPLSAWKQSVAMIVLDFSRPWQLVASLQRWLAVLEGHVAQFDAVEMAQLKQRAVRRFTSFVDPSNKSDAAPDQIEPDDSLLPEGALATNLGIPLIVCCCKVDFVENLERDFDYSDATFEYIEQALRTICLKYGASLCYTSAVSTANCDRLLQLITHSLASVDHAHGKSDNDVAEANETELNVSKWPPPIPVTDAKGSVCVPCGFDSKAKINVGRGADAPPLDKFEETVSPPKTTNQINMDTEDQVYDVQDDTEFVKAMRAICDASPDSAKSTTVSQEHASAAAIAAAASLTPKASSTPTKTPSKKSTPSKGDIKTEDNEVLHNFFNSLINKTKTPDK